ncbi:MAG TPA: ribosome-associated translation inhibitor RaiA [Phaeodactylibacter sp.]|nr:ribosome-associated translation inhibitor RaiA [Phaeodactylibacter sp.]
MKLPLQITSRDFPLSESAEQLIREKAAKLDSVYDQIMGCRVTVETPHSHQHKGNRYNVKIDLTVPGSEMVIKREENEDLYVAIRDAFDAALRKLKEFSSRQKVAKGREGLSALEVDSAEPGAD